MIHSLIGLYLFYRWTVKDDQGWGKNVSCLILVSLNEQAIVKVKASRMQGQFSFKELYMARGIGQTHSQEQLDDYANQHNPNNQAYQDALDNRADQLNPNNDEYWHSRGQQKSDDE
jgi:hypothetical protein